LKQSLVNLVYFYRSVRLNLYGATPPLQIGADAIDLPLIKINQDDTKSPVFAQTATLARCSIADLRGRLKLGHQLFIFYEKEQLLGYFWYSTAGLVVPWEKQLNLLIGQSAAYIWDCKVAAPARNRGLYRSALAQISVLANAETRDKIYIYCNALNIASSRGIERAGFKLIKTIDVRPLLIRRALIQTANKTSLVGPVVSTDIFQPQ
jgi:ribosomal protein S18 acetylase RimI-like enzyme